MVFSYHLHDLLENKHTQTNNKCTLQLEIRSGIRQQLTSDMTSLSMGACGQIMDTSRNNCDDHSTYDATYYT